MDFRLDLDYQEIALQYIQNNKLAEEIQNNIQFVEKYYGDVDSRYKEVEDQQIVYKQLGIIVFSCVEALWKGIVMAVNENCAKRKCSNRQCKYKKFETTEKINRAPVDKVLDHLVNLRLLYVHPFEKEGIEELQQLRNHIHLTRTITDEVDRKIFDKDFIHDVDICQKFAERNRAKIAEVILEKTGMVAIEIFQTIHNYIDVQEMILRKGSVSAKTGKNS